MNRIEERREFFRVEGDVLLSYHRIGEEVDQDTVGTKSPVPVGDRGAKAHAGPADVPALGGPCPCCVGLRMDRMEARLEAILSILSRPPFREEADLAPCVVDISGSGMRFPTRERFQVGERLRVALLLPLSPRQVMRIAGVVVHVSPAAEECGSQAPFRTAIRFDGIEEPDRERIIRYTLQRQADQIRKARMQP
jgi:hypothetical protein